MTDEERTALAEKIAAAMRRMMSQPGEGYIDFTWHPGSTWEDEILLGVAYGIAEQWPDDEVAEPA